MERESWERRPPQVYTLVCVAAEDCILQKTVKIQWISSHIPRIVHLVEKA